MKPINVKNLALKLSFHKSRLLKSSLPPHPIPALGGESQVGAFWKARRVVAWLQCSFPRLKDLVNSPKPATLPLSCLPVPCPFSPFISFLILLGNPSYSWVITILATSSLSQDGLRFSMTLATCLQGGTLLSFWLGRIGIWATIKRSQLVAANFINSPKLS